MIREEKGREEGKKFPLFIRQILWWREADGERGGGRRGTKGRFEAETARCVQDVSLEK